jgi:hypothetical protein
MNRFDKKYNILLNEFLGTLASAAGSFLKAGEDPAYLFNLKQKPNQKKLYGKENPPKVGKLAVYANNTEVVGRVVKPLDKNGQFGIALIKPNGQQSEFEFAQTEKKPYWHIEYTEIVLKNHVDGKDTMLKKKDSKGNDVWQVSPSKEIPYLMVGKNTKFENWISYDDYLKQSKK